jgi:nucleoside-diphosphate-sugar epimerase
MPGSARLKRSVLITGGAGFIATHLGRQLLRSGRAITRLDNCSLLSLRGEALLRNVRVDLPFFFNSMIVTHRLC